MKSPRKRELSDIQSHQASFASTVSASSDISEFLDMKMKCLASEAEYTKHFSEGLLDLKDKCEIPSDQLDDELKMALEKRRKIKDELFATRRQRLLLEEDMDQPGLFNRLEDAYANSIMNRVMSATCRLVRQKLYQSAFRKGLENYYDATQITDDGERQVWCLVTGWHESTQVKAAHIIPKSLSSGELEYLYGSGGDIPSDYRNGLMLYSKIEEALDSGRIVIFPLPSQEDELTEWKIVLADKSIRKRQITGGLYPVTFNDIDGKKLVFRNNNRPARRYLYLRFIMTFLHCKSEGKPTEWIEASDVGKTAWHTPDKSLRRGFLLRFARQFSHEPLPDKVYSEVTPAVPSPTSNRPDEEEELMAEGFASMVKGSIQTAQARASGNVGQYDTDQEYEPTAKSGFDDGDEEKDVEQF